MTVEWSKLLGSAAGTDRCQFIISVGNNLYAAFHSKSFNGANKWNSAFVKISYTGNLEWINLLGDASYLQNYVTQAKVILERPNGNILYVGHGDAYGLGGMDLFFVEVDPVTGIPLEAFAIGGARDDLI